MSTFFWSRKALSHVLAVVLIVLLVVSVGAIIYVVTSQPPSPTPAPTSTPSPTAVPTLTSTPATNQTGGFENPIKSPHWVTNTPEHGTVLAGVPINVVIDFNFDTAPPSSVAILLDVVDYGLGETVIDDNRLAFRRNMRQDAPDGLYRVRYNACWPDGSCHEGSFQFKIDRSRVSGFVDMRDNAEITVNMTNFAFAPKDLLISVGTKVTWVNNDDAEHFVNTDSHPAHTYFPPQNSRGLLKGDSFSVTFNSTGIYPYHCSAHASIMNGTILVG